MDRRTFAKTSIAGAALLITGVPVCGASAQGNKTEKVNRDTKKTFWKYGCAGALFHHVNREYGFPKESDDRSIGLSLSGGIIQMGYQCGMLWGSSIAAGAESFRRYSDHHQAIGMAILASQHVVQSFSKRAHCVNCREITNVDWSNKFGTLKYLITGKLFTCLDLADKWPPEAVSTITNILSSGHNFGHSPVSCASEVARKLGATDEEVVMAATLAGGIGLSGNACGALGAAVWLKSRSWFRENPKSNQFNNAYAKSVVQTFYQKTEARISCSEICGRNFTTVEEHSEFIRSGGCKKLIDILAQV